MTTINDNAPSTNYEVSSIFSSDNISCQELRLQKQLLGNSSPMNHSLLRMRVPMRLLSQWVCVEVPNGPKKIITSFIVTWSKKRVTRSTIELVKWQDRTQILSLSCWNSWPKLHFPSYFSKISNYWITTAILSLTTLYTTAVIQPISTRNPLTFTWSSHQLKFLSSPGEFHRPREPVWNHLPSPKHDVHKYFRVYLQVTSKPSRHERPSRPN